MATVTFVPGTTAPFNPAIDTLFFANTAYSAADLQFVLGTNLQVGINGQYMTLVGAAYASLSSASVSFANGSLFVKGGIANDSLSGANGSDYFDLTGGGDDAASGGRKPNCIEIFDISHESTIP